MKNKQRDPAILSGVKGTEQRGIKRPADQIHSRNSESEKAFFGSWLVGKAVL